MGKKAKNNSKRVKTSHKKSLIKRKVVHMKVDHNLSNINKIISQEIAQRQELHKNSQHSSKVEEEFMSMADLQKLLTAGNVGQPQEKRIRHTKLNVDDANYLESLLKKWGNNYERMAKDYKLNRMQWTSHQIQKKHIAYKALHLDQPLQE